jgi:pimeloyl-ACP methyl ester carboxylesterase
MQELFLLSGLGADKRVFDFLDLSGYQLNYIAWVAPGADEPMAQYAERLLHQINHPKPILIGVSFGGMMAVEIGKLIETEKIILISSAKSKMEIPWYLRFMGALRLHRLIPTSLMKTSSGIANWFFGAKTQKERDLLKSIIRETDSAFLKWAIDKILSWKNETVLSNITHIHGTADRLLPNNRADYPISEGGHLMIINRAKEISHILNSILQSK